ncbi:glucose oxidase [Biscogniauxia mediterranea]|nr:glucose oxidase [Biscogniauxia mediterranea]
MKLMYAKLSWFMLGVSVNAQAYDYVIAGAGTCGLVLANRLSEDPNVSVAVIEPGADVRNNPNVTDVSAFTVAFNTSIDWQYVTTPQPGAGNRSIAYHAGKAIGGTSTINGMTYIRGDKAEFDAWEALGNEGWNWETLFPYFKQVERFTVPSAAQEAAGATYQPDYHGEGGDIYTGFPSRLINGSLHETVQKSWEALGYPLNEDVNGGDVRGFSVWPQTLNRDANIRDDAARAYYYPVEGRPNLRVINGTVSRIIWVNTTTSSADAIAEGVEYITPDGQLVKIDATKEVILSAGALRSPLILERSGVGNTQILNKLGIETKIELPGVGEYLQDQTNTALVYSNALNLTGTSPYAVFASAEDVFGSDTPAIAAATAAKLPGWASQVAAAHQGTISAETIEKLFQIQHDLMFNKNITIAESLVFVTSEYLALAFWLLMPFSWGSVHLTSTEAAGAPEIDPKYFLIDFDLDVQTRLGRLSQEFRYTKPISSVITGSISPTEALLPRNATDAQWWAFLRGAMTPNHHPIGTASMMSRELGGVVDPKLMVYGTTNVRVVDGSILPLQISGHLTATLYAISERAAELIIKGL